MSQFSTSQFLPLLSGHFGSFGMGGAAFPVTLDKSGAGAPETVTPDAGIARNDPAPTYGSGGPLPPYDGYLGPHVPGVCGLPGGFGGFDPAPPLTVPVMWAMRATPAIVLASNYLTFAPATSAPFSMEIADDGGDEEQAKTIQAAASQDLLPAWDRALPGALESLHFASWLQELVWGRRADRGTAGATQGTGAAGGSRVLPVDVRPVLPLEATIHRDPYLRFAGFQIGDAFRGPEYAFLAVNQPHIDPVRGYSRNQNALRDWWRAMQSERNADRTERKASGIHMMLGVGTGSTTYVRPDGTRETIDPHTMAQRIADQASRANVFTVPNMFFDRESIKANPELAKIPAVSVNQFDWGNIGEALKAHLARLDRLDINMVRAWYHGEREGMEAAHGSRADALAHKSGGVLDCESVRAMFARQWDDQVVATWQRQNFPQWQGRLRTKPAPLSDPMQDFLQQVTNTLLANPNTGPDAELELNRRGLLERVSLPLRAPEDVAKDRAALEADKAKQQADAAATAKAAGANGNTNGNGRKPVDLRVERAARKVLGRG